MKWYVWTCSLLVASSGFLWGYETGSINGVKEMPGYRKVLNISRQEPNHTDGVCASSEDDVETSALLGIVITVLHIGCFVGALFAGVLSDVAGRKATVITGVVCCGVGSTVHVGAINIWMVFIGRTIAGLGIGIIYQVAPLYIAEITPKQLRGRLIFFVGLSSVVGILLGNVVNTLIVNLLPSYDWGWRISLAVQTLVSIVLAIGTIFVPETPRWLSKKHRYSKALTVLKRIHQNESTAMSDLEEIKEYILTASKVTFLDTVKFLFHLDILNRLALGFFFQLIGRFGGSLFLVYYSVTLFCHIGVEGYIASIALFTAVLVTQFVGVALIDKVGRKTLLLVSGVFMTVFVAIAASLILVFDLEDLSAQEELSEEKRAAGYIVVMLIVVFMCIFSLSYGIVPFIVSSEIFPLQIRGITVAVSSNGWWGGTIIVSQLSPILLSSLGSYGNLFIITAISVILTVYVLLLIPETKGKSLEEIDLLFKKPWHKRVDILHYLSCACLVPRVCKSKCNSVGRRMIPRRLPVRPPGADDGQEEDNEQLLSLASLSQSDSADSMGLLADHENVGSSDVTMNGSQNVRDSETVL